jgi:DNA-binding transcriptional LysR family regulator
MDLVHAFRLFVRASETHSFSAVARESGISQPAVSHHLAMLEARVQARLFYRNTRSVALTDDGRHLLEHARRVLDAVDQAEQALCRRHDGIVGLVRVAVSPAFGRMRVVPSITKVSNSHSGLEIDLLVDDGEQDLISHGIDIAIRVGPIADCALVSRRIGTTERVPFASVAYLQSCGTPTSPKDLSQHECVGLVREFPSSIWHPENGSEHVEVVFHGRLRCESNDAVREAILSGHGIGLLPEFYFHQEIRSGLVSQIPAEWHEPSKPVYIIYPSRRNLPPRVRVVLEFLLQEFRTAVATGCG